MTWANKLRWYHRSIISLLVCWACFGSDTFVHAAAPIIPGLFEDGIRVGYDQGGIQGFVETAENGLKILYLILWPLLAVAAAAMDNSLVYGGAFYLTNALFKFRQIIRTFANYTIGLYFVGSILAAFFGNKLENVFSGLIKNVAIAAIAVNLSRWVLAALIDLSTLATVTLGALPLHALGNDTVFKENVYFMKTYNKLNINASTAQNADKFDFSLMYGCTQGEGAQATTRHYLPCAINDKKLVQQGSVGEPLSRLQYKEDFINVRKGETNVKTENIDDYYCVYDKQLISNEYGADISDCKVLQQLLVNGKEEGISQCATVDKILTKSVNMSGPLFTIFSSILNMSELGLTTNSGSLKEVGLNLLIKLVFGIALIVPLIALAVVMVIRVVYLWLIIVFSPLITIAVALQWGEGISGKIEGVLSNVLKPTQIISLIFLPVIAVFGLSISIIFLSLLKNLPLIEQKVGPTETAIKAADGCYNDAATALGMKRNETKEGVVYDMDITEVNFSEKLRGTGADIGNMMSWLILNFFGIALMWMVVFATLKTNEFTKGVADTIDKTAKDWMGTVPLPFAGGVGLTTLQKGPEMIKDRLVGDKLQEQEQLLDEFAQQFDPDTKALQKKLVAGQQDPSQLDGLNQNSIPRNTDFLSDYAAGGKAYAQKAKAEYFDKSGAFTDAGKKYAQKTYGNTSTQTAKNIQTSLDSVDSRTTGLANKDFVNWMHTQDGGKGYDKFFETWDKRTVKTGSTVKAMETGLAKLAGPGKYGQEAQNNDSLHWYLYDNNAKLTTFRRDKESKVFKDTAPVSYTIDNTKTAENLTEQDVSTFNTMLTLGREKFSQLGFFKLFTDSTTSAIKNEITIADKKYIATKDAAGNVIEFQPAPTPQ